MRRQGVLPGSKTERRTFPCPAREVLVSPSFPQISLIVHGQVGQVSGGISILGIDSDVLVRKWNLGGPVVNVKLSGDVCLVARGSLEPVQNVVLEVLVGFREVK